MRRVLSVLFACLILCLSVCAVYEVDDDTNFEEIYPLGSEVGSLADIPYSPISAGEVISQGYEVLGNSDVVVGDATLYDVSTMSLPPVTPSSTTGLKSALLSVLGNYDPVVVVYQYQTSSSGYYSYATDIQPDFAWIASAAVLALFILCLFKLGGALLRG